jgi:UDP-N-acetylglucosamine--N-acetylmuramyl-(pentapeptide) pyrophosphoryl-undecaprenol N-acetylglucosamine transferase
LTVLLTGGGSGGHITPLLAIATQLKAIDSNIRIVYIGQKGDNMANVLKNNPYIDETYSIYAGKFRRFHGEGVKQLFDVPVVLKNIRDFFYVFIGIFQSRRLIKRIKPTIVFSRGGYVSVPVALGAKLNNVPYITHDSDPLPSLANRIIAKWAVVHAVALPKEIYPYPQNKTITTGVPINSKFKPVNEKLKEEYRQQLNIPENAKMLFVIGGGLGSQTINRAMTEIAPHLLNEFNELYITHIVGKDNEAEVKSIYESSIEPSKKSRVEVFGYIDDVYKYSGAADLIITRAGATNLAEFAVQGKACIIIPGGFLVGGHQLKSAQYLDEKDAAIVVDEKDLAEDSNRLAKIIISLLNDKTNLISLGSNMSKFANSNATDDIAKLIISNGTK